MAFGKDDTPDGWPIDRPPTPAPAVKGSSHSAYTRITRAAIASVIAALSERALKGRGLPRAVKYLRDGEPNCSPHWSAVWFCVFRNDTEGSTACYNCVEEGLGGLDHEGDFCAQLADKAAADAGWCPAAGACLDGCGKTIDGTHEACEAPWGDLLKCTGLSEEAFVAKMETDPCPDLCAEDGLFASFDDEDDDFLDGVLVDADRSDKFKKCKKKCIEDKCSSVSSDDNTCKTECKKKCDSEDVDGRFEIAGVRSRFRYLGAGL